jgi:hypothetical protein
MPPAFVLSQDQTLRLISPIQAKDPDDANHLIRRKTRFVLLHNEIQPIIQPSLPSQTIDLLSTETRRLRDNLSSINPKDPPPAYPF